MLARAIAVGVAVMAGAVPATAQQRGTVEFGVFAANTSFKKSLNVNSSWGAGARIGMFLFPRLSAEFEAGGGRSSRPLGLQTVNQTSIGARFTGVPVKAGPFSLLLGAGAVHTDYQINQTFGFQGLIGAKMALSSAVALRVDAIQDWNSNPAGAKANTRHLQIGLTIYRNPAVYVRTGHPTVMDPSPQQPDSVSAAETWRLRMIAASYQALRDSLGRPAPYVAPSSAAALATMREMIYFENDRSNISDSAKAVLDSKVTVFKANPAMRIVITGFASQPGTEAYNMTLGRQRADAAKEYLVSRGVDPVRIEIATKGEGQLVVEGPGELADAENRRGQFRLLIADPYLAAPKK